MARSPLCLARNTSKGLGLRDLIGGSWSGVRRVSTDLSLGLGVWLVYLIVYVIPAGAILRLLRVRAQIANPLVPYHSSTADSILFVLLMLSAAFCEEVIFRGYFQRQLAALTGSTVAAVLLQAIVFSSGHVYEGLRGVASAGIIGVLFGLLACWRKSLRPGMISHAWADVFAGLIAGTF